MMSTLAPLPVTLLTDVNACGGVGVTDISSRSELWMRVRAPMLFLATTTLVPVPVAGKMYGALARAAAARKATRARAVPMMMYRRLRRGRPMGELAAITGANDALNAWDSLHQNSFDRGRADAVVAADRRS